MPKERSPRQFSILYRLLFSFLSLVIATAGVLTSISYFHFKKASLASAEAEIGQQFNSITYSFTEEIQQLTMRDLNVITANPVLDQYLMASSFDRDIEARKVERLFVETIANGEGYRNISFIDHTGMEKISVTPQGRARNYRNLATTPLFSRLAAGNKGNIITIPPKTGPDGGICSYSVAAYKSDPDYGGFGGMILFEATLGEFMDFARGMQFSEVNDVWILGVDGTIIHQPKDDKFLDPRPFMTAELQRKDKLVVVPEGMIIFQDYELIEGSPFFRIAISVPSALIFKDVSSALEFFLIVFFFSVVVAAFLAFSMSRHLTRPLIALADAVTGITKHHDFTSVAVTATGEVGTLVASFNHMFDVLRQTTVSRDYVDNIIRAMLNSLIVTTPDGRIEVVNEATCTLLGYTEQELLGQPFDTILRSDFLKFNDLIAGDNIQALELRYLAKTGGSMPVLFSSSAMKDSNGMVRGFVCMAQDITEKKQAEAKLHQAFGRLKQAQEDLLRAERLAAVGEASGRVAHEVLNPVSCVMSRIEHNVAQCAEFRKLLGNAREIIADWQTEYRDGKLAAYLQTKTAEGSNYGDEDFDLLNRLLDNVTTFQLEREKDLQFLLKQIQRIVKIINALRESTRTQRSIHAIDITHPIHESLELLEDSMAKRKIRIETKAPDRLPPVLADETELIQVFSNLYRNAMQSIDEKNSRSSRPDGGSVASAGDGAGATGLITTTVCLNGDNIEVRIQDSGTGISEQHRESLFDFSFTTKTRDQGTGFGLGISRRLVRQIGGDLVLAETRKNEGTTFLITIPVKAQGNIIMLKTA